MEAIQSLTYRLSSAFAWNASKVEEDSKLHSNETPNWWKLGTVYQIWPASFKDSNGDGIGDIPGILEKLDYLQDLGVDIIWLSPMYASPQKDMGYDISDYNAVEPKFGTMKDMEKLIKALHDRGMKLLLDLVINHTSDQHAWFKESRKSRTNKHSDWYIWKDPKIDENGKKHPPNNWGSFFGGPAWTYAPERDQYYLHLFDTSQPDINWENAETRQAVHETALRFWFEKGVDGFRVDAATIYSKVQTFPDALVTPEMAPYGDGHKYCVNGPRIHEFYQEIRKSVLDNYGDPMMVGEFGILTIKEILKYIGKDRRELSMAFDFGFTTVGGTKLKPFHDDQVWTLPEMKTALNKTQDLVAGKDGWSTIFGENHDIPRSISRFGTVGRGEAGKTDPKYRERASKLLAMMLGSLSGTLFIYQGQEIGMTNIPSDWSPKDLRDIVSLNYLKEIQDEYPNDEEMLQRAWQMIVNLGRDNARTPVQWSDDDHAGFTSGQPWMRVNDNYKDINVASQLRTNESILRFWMQILSFRKKHIDVFLQGQYHVHDFDNLHTFCFEKKAANGKSALVMLNFTSEDRSASVLETFKDKKMKLAISNVANPEGYLSPWEGRIYLEE
ncbi:glycoside hydrolase [Acephala macrosclerotiorum]|nr:glycoside hydrolase [Acephala macrosclerotiorum]